MSRPADLMEDREGEMVDRDLAYEIERFLYREARLLDEERYEDWLGLLAEDIHYWMPGIQARYRRDGDATISPTRMAHFDDDLDYLRKRVSRFRQKSAWAEDPPTRHFHLVSNVEVLATERPDEWRVHSLVVNVRHRSETDQVQLTARRKDLVRRVGTELRLARRDIFLQQTVLAARNLNTFL